MSKYIKIRDWLDRNKIIFETLTAVLLMTAAVVVSFEANRISSYQVQIMSYQTEIMSNQTEIMSYQTELMKSEKQPIFDLVIKFESRPDETYYLGEKIIISNCGLPIRKFDCETLVYLFVMAHGGEIKEFQGNNIPLHGYYDSKILLENNTGDLAILSNYGIYEGNFKKGYKLIEDLGVYFFCEKNATFATYRIDRYVWINYEDIYGEKHEEMYYVDRFEPQKLSEHEMESLIGRYEHSDSIEFSEASLDSILPKIKHPMVVKTNGYDVFVRH